MKHVNELYRKFDVKVYHCFKNDDESYDCSVRTAVNSILLLPHFLGKNFYTSILLKYKLAILIN